MHVFKYVFPHTCNDNTKIHIITKIILDIDRNLTLLSLNTSVGKGFYPSQDLCPMLLCNIGNGVIQGGEHRSQFKHDFSDMKNCAKDKNQCFRIYMPITISFQ